MEFTGVRHDPALQAQFSRETDYSWKALPIAADDIAQSTTDMLANTIRLKAERLFSAGAVSQEDSARMYRAAASGFLFVPGLTSAVEKDEIGKTAYYAMMARTGLNDLWALCLREIGRDVSETALNRARTQAYWDIAYDACEFVSGKAAFDKLSDYLAKIRSSMAAIRETEALARENLWDDPEGADLVSAESKAAESQVTYLSGYISDTDYPSGLAAVQVVAVVAIGAALGIAAVCWTVIRSKEEGVKRLYLERLRDQEARLSEFEEERRMANDAEAESWAAYEIEQVDARVAAGEITQEQAKVEKARINAMLAEQKASNADQAAEAQRDIAEKTNEAAKQLPKGETGKVTLGLAIGLGIAVVALGAVAVLAAKK